MAAAPALSLFAWLATVRLPAAGADAVPAATEGLDTGVPGEHAELVALPAVAPGAATAVGEDVPPAAPAEAERPQPATPLAFELEVEALARPAGAAHPDPGPEMPESSRPDPAQTGGDKERAFAPPVPLALENTGREPKAPANIETPEPLKEPGRTAEALPESRPATAGPEIPITTGAAGSGPRERPAPMKVAEAMPPPEPPRSAPPPRVTVRLEPREGVSAPPVDVVVAQRGPALHFSVHSADGRLGAEMQSSIGDLTERLETLGFRASAVAIVERTPEVRESLPPERAWDEGGYSSGSGSSGSEKRQGRRDRDQWKQEMEKHNAA